MRSQCESVRMGDELYTPSSCGPGYVLSKQGLNLNERVIQARCDAIFGTHVRI